MDSHYFFDQCNKRSPVKLSVPCTSKRLRSLKFYAKYPV